MSYSNDLQDNRMGASENLLPLPISHKSAPSDYIQHWWIYKITSPPGRIYIGKTKNFIARVNKYKHYNAPYQRVLRNSFLKYGFLAHTIEVIDEFDSNSEFASGKEIFWIKSFMSNVCKYPIQIGLNLTNGGEGTTGSKRTKEACQRMSEGKNRANKNVFVYDLNNKYIISFYASDIGIKPENIKSNKYIFKF